jgi:hypothetical protein
MSKAKVEEETEASEKKQAPKKLCPLSAGNEVDWWICAEKKCMWWDERNNQCLLKTATTALIEIATYLDGIEKELEELNDILVER